MPEVFIPKHPYIKDFFGPVPRQRKLSNTNEVKNLGVGGESLVLAIPADSDKAYAIAYEGLTPERAKGQYYLHRMMSTLFPHNFPHFYAAFSGEKVDILSTKFSGTVRQRVHQGEGLIKFPFKKVIEDCEKMSIPIIYSDTASACNRMAGADGGEYYVDNLAGLVATIRHIGDDDCSYWNLRRIMNYMRQNHYAQEDMLTVARSFERLYVLIQQEKADTERVA